VLCSYVLGELADGHAMAVLERAWRATRTALVIVEPGWPRGHARLLAWRDRLMGWGAHVIAPCPHDLACPLAGGDWCHFAARLDRTRLHRLVKGAALGWEDEKFAYLVAARLPALRPSARIIGPPRIEKGHVGLRLCHDGRADDVVVARREGTAFKAARKADWGDGWPRASG
jgi:ribosomal protein RSM22 (predicted rRNA methylase)